MSSGGCKRRAREQRRASAFQWPTRSDRCKSSVHERLEGRGGVTGVARMTDHRKLLVGDGGRACAFVCTKWVYYTGFMRRCLFSFPARPVCIRLLWLFLLVRPHRDVYLSPRARGGGGVRCCRSQRQPQQQTTKQSTEVLKASPVHPRSKTCHNRVTLGVWRRGTFATSEKAV